MPPPILRIPTLEGEPWAELAVLGRFVREVALRSAFGYVLLVQSHRASTGALEWHVHTKNADGKSFQNSGATIEAAFERALVRLTQGG